MKYYVVIPAHNEEAFLKNMLDSLVAQTLLPKRAVIVNDNSTDQTEAIIDVFIKQYPFLEKLNTTSTSTHMPGSKVVNAFNKGFAVLDNDYDFIVKLDADLILPKNYFENIAHIFKTNSNVGIAGGFIFEKDENDSWKLNHPMDKKHVRGAFKAYSKECFKAIGGLKSAMGWDTVDELLAQYHKFTTYTDSNLHVKHLRPTGKSYNKKAKLLQGKAMYSMRYGFFITAIASLKMALKQHKIETFFDNIHGYFKAKKEKTPFLISEEEGVFIRNYRLKNMKKKLF